MTSRKAKPPADIRQIDPKHPALTFSPSRGENAHEHGLDKIPPSYIRYRGKGDPVGTDAEGKAPLLKLVIRTAHGLSTAGPRRVVEEEWAMPATELGSIAAYQRVTIK